MALVTGKLTDFGLAALAPFKPEIVFTPNGNAISPTSLLSTKPVVAVPAANGTFSVQLAPTVDVHPATWYRVSVRWLEPDSFGSGYAGMDFPDWKLFVPLEGGTLTRLLELPANPAQVWVGVDPPTNPTPGLWWLQHNGDLSEWSN